MCDGIDRYCLVISWQVNWVRARIYFRYLFFVFCSLEISIFYALYNGRKWIRNVHFKLEENEMKLYQTVCVRARKLYLYIHTSIWLYLILSKFRYFHFESASIFDQKKKETCIFLDNFIQISNQNQNLFRELDKMILLQLIWKWIRKIEIENGMSRKCIKNYFDYSYFVDLYDDFGAMTLFCVSAMLLTQCAVN